MSQTQRLDKLLSNFGFGTRKEVKQLIKEGAIRVDGEIASDSGMHVNPETSSVEVHGKQLRYREFVYVMMNKPAGVVSATFDNRWKTVVDLLSSEYRCFNLFPVGRLDIDTEGLLLMTNDGQLAHDLLAPRKHVPKKYFAQVEGRVNQEDIAHFSQGVILEDGYKTLPASLRIIVEAELSETEVVIHEGKFHQVKRMFEAVGKKVCYLKRLEMGPLKLDENLKPGEYRELSKDELELLKNVNR